MPMKNIPYSRGGEARTAASTRRMTRSSGRNERCCVDLDVEVLPSDLWPQIVGLARRTRHGIDYNDAP